MTLEQNSYGLGISLAGHRDRDTMRPYICGLHPRGPAHQSGLLQAGDLLVRVGGHVVWDRCHLVVTSIIKQLSSTEPVQLTVVRGPGCLAQLSVPPLTRYPLLLDDMVRSTEYWQSLIYLCTDIRGRGVRPVSGATRAAGPQRKGGAGHYDH